MPFMNHIYEEITVAITKYKDKIAAIYYEEGCLNKLNYADLKRVSDIIYENLKYITKGSICFGLLMNHNIYIPSLILSIHKLKCTFIFLDVDQQENNIINKLGIQYIISYKQQCNIHNVKLLYSIVVDTNEMCNVYFVESQYKEYENINYIVQTSGTTHLQKLVRVEHQCIASNIACLRKKLSVTSKDVIYFGTCLTFDPSIIELYLALTAGAKLFIVSKEIRANSSLLYKLLFQSKSFNITLLQMCPSIFMQWSLIEIQNIFQNSNLRVLLLGGEDFPAVLQTIQRSEQLRIFNIYGITELSCWAMLSDLNDEEVSLGEVLDDTIFEIRDEKGENITKGEGELYVGSFERICYVNDEEPDTIEKPLMRRTGDRVKIENNKIIYIGRSNDIIKRFGHRVDLNYIENCIQLNTGLRSVCVWSNSKHQLILFLLIDEGNTVKIIDKLRVKLLHVLPKAYLPDHIESLSTLPLTKNGKVDKKKLLNRANILLKQYKLSMVEAFDMLWHKYFGRNNPELIRKKTFYELGGNSVLRVQFSAELKQNYVGLIDSHILDYVYSNTYDDIHTFLRNFQITSSKRKIVDECNVKPKILKEYNEVSMEILWTYDLKACVDSTPVVAPHKRLVAVGSFSNIFVLVNIDTGKEVIKVVLPNTIENSCLISQCENFIYVGCFDCNMYCIEIPSGKIRWSYKTGDYIKNKPCFVNEDSAIVFGSYDTYLYCINAMTGLKIWKLYMGAPVTADVISFNKKLVTATIRGTCMCLSDHGDILWQNQFSCPIFGSPTKLKNAFVVPDVLGTVHCFNLDGEKLWEFKVNGNIYSSILSYENMLIFGCHDAVIYCLDYSADNLKPKLRNTVSIDSATSSAVSSLTYNNRTSIVVTCITGYIYLIDVTSFSVQSTMKLDGDIFSSPAICQNKIFIGCRDNNLICFEVH